METRQGGSRSPSAGTGSRNLSAGGDSQGPSNEPSAEQRQLNAMLARLPEVPYPQLPLGATIAHREGHMVGS